MVQDVFGTPAAAHGILQGFLMAADFNIPPEYNSNVQYLGSINDKGEINPPQSESPAIPNLNLLVSFCNVWPHGFTVAVVNIRSGFFDFVGATPDREGFVGADGIIPMTQGRYAIIDQRGWSGRSGYTILDSGLNVSKSFDLGDNLDLHDLAAYRSGFAFSVSARDQVLLKRDGKPDKIIYATGSDADTVHINGLTTRRGRIYCSMFGPRKGESWRESSDGQVIDCVSGDVIASHLHQPHTPTATAEGLWICESGHSNILFFDNAGVRHCVARLRGYLRGLMVTPRYVVAGASAARRKSRHLGVAVEIREVDNHIETSRLYVLDRKTGALWARDIPHIGHEIFAICPYTGPRRPSLDSTLTSMQRRMYEASSID
jgi:hypothetical protein